MPTFRVDGHALDFEVHGERGRPLVVLHTLGLDRRLLLESCEPALAGSGWRRVYVDLPGHGRSTANEARASTDDLVAAAAAFVAAQEAGEGAPCVLGHAYGASLALRLVGRVALGGLCLVCPTAQLDPALRTLPPHRELRAAELPFAGAEERDAFGKSVVRQTPTVLDAYRRLVQPAHDATNVPFAAAVQERYLSVRAMGAALAAFARPVALVCGRDDRVVGYADALPLVRLLVDASLTVVPGCGHLLPLEAPEALARVIEEWVARVNAAG